MHQQTVSASRCSTHWVKGNPVSGTRQPRQLKWSEKSRLRVLIAALILVVSGSSPSVVSILGAVAFTLTVMNTRHAAAQVNALCSGSPTANCTDVTASGIRYTSGVTEVNVGDGVAGQAAVNAGVIGIALTRVGASGLDANPSASFDTIPWDTDNDPNTADVSVVTRDGATPHLVSSDFIFDNGGNPRTYTIGTTDYSGVALAEFLAETQVDTGATITGGLTINNNVDTNGPNPSAGAAISTNNAEGILVNSTGGKGGNGGCTTILLATWCDDGDRGGNAGSVVVNSNSPIVVNGTAAGKHGIAAFSQGGVGGNGGGAFGLFVSDAGRGGNGGTGSAVFVTLDIDSNITTQGARSHGVFARSKGGDGGSGGDPSSLVALGDEGGNGGNAGSVNVDNDGSILTTGANAYGIYALSIGAGAGSGSNSGGLVAIGGNGGGQSDGNKVTVTNTGAIETTNSNAFGIFAQSVGGGGGDGGGAGGLIAIGGRGTSGGDSDVVSVTNFGSVKTAQQGSTAIFAQSVGGGGGNGGFAVSVAPVVSVAVGGKAGPGGDGEAVSVTLRDGSDIDTSAGESSGVVAQSIGGGGGNGGFALSLAVPSAQPISASVAVGGTGGQGGRAGTVDVTSASATDIDTNGDDSSGIVAQSIGGGGGNGGFAISGAASPISIAVGIGGAGGGGGDSDAVTVNNDGTITTNGQRAKGIFAQSIGGGGGTGGLSVAASVGIGSVSVGVGGTGGAAGNVSLNKLVLVDNNGDILTRQSDSHGVHAQSVGGGGGAGGSTFSAALSAGVVAGSAAIGVGGDGGGGGFGQGVRIINRGEIETIQDRSYGLVAQSIGGGGGDGGLAVAAAVSFSEKLNVAIGVPVGGAGGDAGTGSWVDVNNSNSIMTAGELSHGILGQSIGGGGGAGGASIAATVSVGTGASGAIGVAIGGGGGAGGRAERVDIANTGSIVTGKNGATGIRAQSIGGGGGTGGFAGGFGLTVGGSGSAAANVTVGGGGGTGNYSNVVDVNNNASITTGGDSAPGIYAESIGGGGGSAGAAANVSAAFSTAGSGMSVGVGVGGAGGVGNDGAVVEVTSKGSITTGVLGGLTGYLSHGIHATSIGGGGGTAGFVASVAASGSSQAGGSVGVSVGGTGGNGGVGRNVGVGVLLNQTDITNNVPGSAYGGVIGVDPILGTITTHGTEAHGIYAESIGGGGGNGGFAGAFTGSFNTSSSKTLSLSVAVGGKGGNGGSAGDVYVDSAAIVSVNGNRSNGILARSVGGGGGTGGGSAAGAFGGSDSITINVSVGGAGGLGTQAGNVTVNNSGNITLASGSGPAESEDENGAIVAQSIGGGGGNGGFAFSTAVGGPQNRGINVSVGGNGGGIKDGNGNDKTTDGKDALSGTVTVTNAGVIVTDGGEAHGILGQSIGGSGGNGGFAAAIGVSVIPPDNTQWNVNASVAVGGVGGDGNEGGIVDITNLNLVTTNADNSHAIYAQSIGGGGGNGGIAFSGNVGLGNGDGKSFQAAVSIGGNGGDGDHGGQVQVTNNSALETFGDISHGVLAQSIGGGGGAGGGANALNLQINKGNFDPFAKFSANKLKLEIAVGGTGGSGQNDGGTVSVANDGDITTRGDQARGIWAQSVGGGGGNGGMGALSTGYAEGDLGAAVATCLPCNLPNIFDPTDLSVIVGGDAGANGNGSVVTVDHAATITTVGSFSHGIYAQSIGGGGGEALLWAKDSESSIGGNAAIGPNGKFGIGGAGGAAGNGGDVTVNMASIGGVETWGTEAHGIFAQSIGGGGGMSGSIDRSLPNPNFLQAITGVTDFPNIGLGFGFARSGGGGGDGGNLTIDSDGNIATHGDSSIGILAQSVGGGGGLAGGTGIGLTIAVFSGSVGGNGSAGTISLRQTGNITTSGYAAHGIFAQSAGGGNGANIGLGKLVDISLEGAVDTSGQNAIGVLAQSIGADGNGNINVTLAERSSVVGGTLVGLVTSAQPEVAAGIQLLDGAVNTVTNRGMVTTHDGVTGMAIAATTGDDTVDNWGTVTGNVSLGVGTNEFNNNEGAIFNTGAMVDVGAGNKFNNDGTLFPGGFDRVLTTNVSGDLVQSASGKYVADLDFKTAQADRVDVTGTSSLDGTINISRLNSGFAAPGSKQLSIISSEGGVVDKSNLALSFVPSAVISYELLYPNAKDVVLSYNVDYDASTKRGRSNQNRSAFGQYVNAIQRAGGSEEFAPIVEKLVAMPDDASLGKAYDQLSPEPFLATSTTAVQSGLRFSDALHSCRVREGEFRFVSEGECSWLRLVGSKLNQDRTDSNMGFEREAYTVAAGAQKSVNENWHAGFGFSIDTSTLHVGDNAKSDGTLLNIGLIAKRNEGAIAFSTSVDVGYGHYNNARVVDLLVPGTIAVSEQDVGLVSMHFRLSQDIERNDIWYLRPMIDAGITYVYHSGFDERGAGAANLLVESGEEALVSMTSALELGREFTTAGGTLIRPFTSIGITKFGSGTTTGITASLQGAPVGTTPFTTKNKMDSTYADLTVGMDALSSDGTTLRFTYTSQFSEHSEFHSGDLKLAIPF